MERRHYLRALKVGPLRRSGRGARAAGGPDLGSNKEPPGGGAFRLRNSGLGTACMAAALSATLATFTARRTVSAALSAEAGVAARSVSAFAARAAVASTTITARATVAIPTTESAAATTAIATRAAIAVATTESAAV